MGGDQVWTPANFDHRALGPIRLRRALTQSRNLAAIDLLDRIGIDNARTFAARFGFDAVRLPRNLTLALGTGEVSLPEMAAAYAVFANGGLAITPYLISRIEDREGQVLVQANPQHACDRCWFQDPGQPTESPPIATSGLLKARRVLEPWLAFQMHSMLQDVVRTGTGRRALALRRADLAGKTGTTNEERDAWFCGYQRDLVAVAWMGFDDSAPLGRGETGGVSALSLWMAFMGEALKGRPEAVMPVPSDLVQVWVADADGSLAHAGDAGAIIEWVREQDLAPLVEPDPVSIIDDQGSTDVRAPSIVEEVY
jgi:penicillin-binding protein 1A